MLLCSHFSVVTNIVRHHPRGLSAFSPMPRKLLDISQDNRRILDCLSFLVEKKKRKKFLISTPFLSRFFSFGPIWHRVIEVVFYFTRAIHGAPKKPREPLYKILATGNLRLGPRRPETCLKVAGMGYEDINSSPYLYKNCHLR